MKKIINQAETVVPDMLEGMTRVHPHLRRLGDYTTIIRSNLTPKKVGLVSGGGSGHEPAHGGFVGTGMLDAACAGDVFTSPSSDQILKAVEAVDTGAGVLLIVKNYQGDVLNFSLAQELAREEGIEVEQIVVADDVSIPRRGDRRGVAGTILVHKVAGAAAESGANLSEVKRVAELAAGRIGSMGVALKPCIVPTAGAPTFELAEDEIELGIGIHGERGVRTTKLMSADALGAELVRAIVQDMSLADGDHVALLVNGMGATPLLELYIAARGIHDAVLQSGLVVRLALVGNLMTSLEMAGLSVTLFQLNRELEQLLYAATEAPAFPRIETSAGRSRV